MSQYYDYAIAVRRSDRILSHIRLITRNYNFSVLLRFPYLSKYKQ
ncbi:MAG: hypothetical protein RMX96_21395 [Nostoc sp. ChiSLP02]|nr:hypothetical protein [Nostoc sp. DedSLP05]MDZ8098093.1 hypothetical protein [Nostoc sp. DedSLP01]MDZ8187390.1 hypothetical protein [Nostoc sp. ChiSLP02]